MGFIDTKGRVVTDAKFLAAAHFSDGLAAVKTEDGWGFIDRTGKMVVSPQFDSASMFQNGLALVTVGGKEAYVTTAGAFVIDPFPGRSVPPRAPEPGAPAVTTPPSTGRGPSPGFNLSELVKNAVVANPCLEVVSADSRSETITFRNTKTKQSVTVTAEQIKSGKLNLCGGE